MGVGSDTRVCTTYQWPWPKEEWFLPTAASNCCNLKELTIRFWGEQFCIIITLLSPYHSCFCDYVHHASCTTSFSVCLRRGGMWVSTDSSEELLCTGLSTYILLIAVHALTQPRHFPQAYSIWLVPRALPLTLQEAASFVHLPYSTAQWEDEDFVFVRMASLFASCSCDKDHDWK